MNARPAVRASRRRGAILLAAGLALIAVACSSPTPSGPSETGGGADGAPASDGGSSVDFGRATNPPPGPDPALIQFTIEPPDPDAPYPPPVEAVDPSPYPGPTDAADDASDAGGDG